MNKLFSFHRRFFKHNTTHLLFNYAFLSTNRNNLFSIKSIACCSQTNFLLLFSRNFSVKPKKSEPIIDANKGQNDIILSDSLPFIELDEKRFDGLTKEFEVGLNKKQLQKLDNVWKDVQPLTVSKTLNHYSELSKLKLTGKHR